MADTSKKLTYAGAVGVLQGGGSVFWRDRAGVQHLISALAALPPEHVWVAGDPAGEATARATLEAQVAALNTQLAALTARMDAPPTEDAAPPEDAPADPSTGKGKGKGKASDAAPPADPGTA